MKAQFLRFSPLLCLLALLAACSQAPLAPKASPTALQAQALTVGTPTELTASDGAAYDIFGYSVALSDDGRTAIVGTPQANNATGAVYIFTDSDGTWNQTKLTATGGAAGDYFGYSVSLSGDGSTAIVGADGVTSYTGAAYIFTKSSDGSGTWNQTKLTATGGAAGDEFGWSVALSRDGRTAIVGAPNVNSAYIFTKSNGSWSQTAKLTGAVSQFGFSVSLLSDGSTAIVGTPYANSNQGTAYIFTKSSDGSGTWNQTKLTATGGAAGDFFGFSVALSGNGNTSTAIVGAPYANDATGTAYIFTRGDGSWDQTAKLTATGGAKGDTFGYSVSLSRDGNTAIVGADGVTSHTGAAYIFTNGGSSWNQTAELTATGGAKGDVFGFSVALSGVDSTAIVGAGGVNSSKGAAYVYPLSSTQDQTITFGPLSNKTYGDSPFSISATASSGLPVSFAASGQCTVTASIFSNGVSSATVTLTGAGSCTITASQAGNDDYSPAKDVSQTFTIAKASQQITFTSTPPSPFHVNDTYTVEATGGASGNAVTFSSGTPAVCTVSDDTVKAIAVGTCTVDANQAGNDDYNPAPSVSQTFNVDYAFAGFDRPIDNLPTVNKVKAGRAIPVKFSLGGDFGLNILASGSPSSQEAACDSGSPTSDVEQTVTAGHSSLQYDADTDTYTYVWKTGKSWSGCRQLNVTLNDGSTHSALFKFR